jgi:hypothetical protein
MKLFLIKYKIELGQGADALTFKDRMAIPGKSMALAKSMFLEIMSGAGAIIMSPGRTKILVPMRALGGRLMIESCKLVSPK